MENKAALKRNSNIELYRIIVMLSIVAHHYVVNSGIEDVMELAPTSGRSIYYYLFGAWGKVGINCFVLITGYFMCKSHITAEKFLKLLLEVMFYKILIHGIFMIAGAEEICLKNIFFMFMPVTSVKTDFVSCFLLFFLCIPFLNIMVRNMTQRQHQLLLALLLGIFTILGTMLGGRFKTNYVTWFCVLYFISSYIRLYNPLPKLRWGYVMGGGTFDFSPKYCCHSLCKCIYRQDVATVLFCQRLVQDIGSCPICKHVHVVQGHEGTSVEDYQSYSPVLFRRFTHTCQ